MPDLPLKLRMRAEETPEELSRRVSHEQSAANLSRESGFEGALSGYRVGSVRYLNAVPLTRGIEEDVLFATPSELAVLLAKGELDAALVSVTEPLLRGAYDILDGAAIASLGEVQSVFLAHNGPVEAAREVFCDVASLTSVNLLKVLLAEQGLQPAFKPLTSYDFASLPDYALLIGDTALHFVRSPRKHQIWDLGEAWYRLTGLPFVYAAWALRRDKDTGRLRRILREACVFGLDTLDAIIAERTEFDYDFRKDYLGWHIHYHLGSDEKRGLLRFADLLKKHNLGPVYDPRFVR